MGRIVGYTTTKLAKQLCICGHPKWQHEDFMTTRCNAIVDHQICGCQKFKRKDSN